MQCIICRATKLPDEFSKEHVIPEALGGTLVTRRVCRACNSTLGQRADAPLVNNSVMLFARMAYQISGKSGVPNAFAGTARLADSPEQLVQVRADAEGNSIEIHHLPRREPLIGEDGIKRFRVVVDASEREELPGMVNKILRREGAPTLPPEEILRNARIERHQPVVEKTITYDVRSPMLGMLKIAYELAYLWLGEAYLQDRTGHSITRALLSSDENWPTTFGIRGSIGLNEEQSPLRMWADDKTSHVALMIQNGPTLRVMVSLFQTFDANIVVSESAETYGPIEARFLALNATTGEIREAALEDELARRLPDSETAPDGDT